jgi:hypothetical protein
MEKGRAESRPDSILLGLAISEEERNIAACLFVKDGELKRHEIQKPRFEVLKVTETGGTN